MGAPRPCARKVIRRRCRRLDNLVRAHVLSCVHRVQGEFGSYDGWAHHSCENCAQRGGVLAGLTEALLRFRFGDDSVSSPYSTWTLFSGSRAAHPRRRPRPHEPPRRRAREATHAAGGGCTALCRRPDVVIALFAILPTSRLLEVAWEIRFSAGVPSQATQQICAQELSALSDLLFYRCVLRGAVLLLRATLYRPDPVHTGLRLLSDEWHRSVPSPVASLAVQISGVARLLACTPPTWAFWESTALAVLSHTPIRGCSYSCRAL